MYAPKGMSFSDVGDIEVVAFGDDLHLFHLTLPNHDVVQHRVSTDGLSWRALPNALRTGDPGACDDDQIWTMSVTPHEGRWVMVYTALSLAEGGKVQRTAIATSDDLIHWTKGDANPVAEADPRWYETDLSQSGAVSWRDPKPIKIGEISYAVVNAREAQGPLPRRGCVGLLSSPDLETWTVHPPLFAPRAHWDLECPQVFRIGEHFYLMAAVIEDGSQRYWVADRFEGPYDVPADGGILAPPGHYAGRVSRWKGQDLFFCWHETRPRTRSRAYLPAADWATTRNASGKYVVAPLELVPRPDGSLACRSFSGWDGYRTEALIPATPMAASLVQGSTSHGGDWRLGDDRGGMDMLATETIHDDVWFEGTLTFDAARGGIVFRLEDDTSGYTITLTRGGQEVLLHKVFVTTDPFNGQRWFTFTVLQQGTLREPIRPSEAIPFQLLSVGPTIECSLRGEVVLSTLSGERTRGRVGLWAESGYVTATEVRTAAMRTPEHG